jgi:hypothetical protein
MDQIRQSVLTEEGQVPTSLGGLSHFFPAIKLALVAAYPGARQSCFGAGLGIMVMRSGYE